MAWVCRLPILFLLIATTALAQNNGEGPPVIAPRHNTSVRPKPARTLPTLLLICDLPCIVSVDGQSLGQLPADGSVRTTVEVGQHAIIATSEDGLDAVRQTTEVKSSGQTVFMVALRPVRGARLQQEQVQTEQRHAEELRKQQEEARLKLQRAQAEANYQQGKSMVDRRRYAEALPLLTQSCDAGNAGGCAWLGRLYANGFGVTKDYALAMKLFTKGCDGGALRGCSGQGFLYNNGFGVSIDSIHARELFERACNGGDSIGCNNLGALYLNGGVGVPPDAVRAVALYRRACEGGAMISCGNLGAVYREGKVVTQDYAASNRYLQQACVGEEPSGCLGLGYNYEKGFGFSKSRSKAAENYRKACDFGDQRGCERARNLQ